MANEANESTKWLYEQLKGKGYNVGKDVNEFDSLLRSNADSRQWAYDTATRSGLNVGKDFDEFSSLVGGSSSPTSVVDTALDQTAEVQPSTEKKQEGWKPTPMQKAFMIGSAQSSLNSFKAKTDASLERVKNTSEYYSRGGAINRSLPVKGDLRYNAEAGKMEQTYLTPTGTATADRVAAERETRAYNDYVDNMTVSGQLRRAGRDLSDLYRKREERVKAIHDKWAADQKKNTAPLAAVLGAQTYVPSIQSDSEYRALTAAIHQAEKRVQTLQHENDRQDGKDVGFWRGVGEVVGDIKTWDFGYSELMDAMTMLDATSNPSPNRPAKTDAQKEAEQIMLEQTYEAQQAQGAYGQNDSFWNRAGVMTGEMLPFMLDFAIMGGAKGGTSMVTRNLDTILLRSLHNAAPKIARNKAVQWTTKALGAMPEDLLYRAPLMTNTVQGMKTASDIIDRKLGDVVIREDGTYDFSNDKTWGSAIWQGEANAIIENYSEMFGSHLDGVLSLKTVGKLADTFGAKRLSGMLTKASNSELVGIAGTMQKHLNQLGLSDYFGEVGEEYYGQLWRTMLNLDDAYKQNPDGSRTNLFLDGQFHGDIWGGMALSMGLMGAGKYSISAAAYGSMKHCVNKTDARASEIFTPEVWDGWRERIDGTTNDKIGDMAEAIVADQTLTDEQRTAAMNYMEASLNLRGFNLASVARQRGGEMSEEEAAANESYMDGYSASTPQEMRDAKKMLDLQHLRLASALSEDLVQDFDNDPIGALSITHDPELRRIATDYVNAKMVYDGMIQRVRDDVDGRIAQSDAMIDSRINRETGMIQPATMKIDDRKVYIVNGTVALYEDGTGVDVQNSSESIIIRDAETGKVEFADPTQFLSVEEAIDAETEKDEARNQIINEFAVAAANNIDGVLSFNPGDKYSILDIESNQQSVSVLGQTADENGMPIDGYVDIQFPDGSIVSVATSDLQQMVDDANTQRVELFDNEHQAQRAADEEAAQPDTEINPIENDGVIEIPTDQNGEPIYEQAEPDTAWDALVEQSDGDEDIARSVIEQTISEKEVELKELSKQKPKAGLSTSQKIQAEKDKKKAMEDIQQSIDHWKRMSGTKQRRHAEEDAIRNAEAEEARVKAEQERAEREEAERIERGAGATDDSRGGGNLRVGGKGETATQEERLTKEEASGIIAEMEENAIVAPEIELTIENWDAQFGVDGIVSTPIGNVKMGENQFTKLMRQERNGNLGMIKPTLETPDIIIEDASEAKDAAATERESSYVFVKTFVKPDGSRYSSVTVSKDGYEVVISNQEKRRNVLTNLLMKGKLVWKHADDASSASDIADGLFSPQGNMSDLVSEGTDAPQTNVSDRKVNNSVSDKQVSGSESSLQPSDNKGEQTIQTAVEAASAQVNTEPTPAQAEAGNYKKGHVTIGEFDITIENPAGSVRKGVDANGKEWSIQMANTYGYIKGTEGVDGDHIDVFLHSDMDQWNGRKLFVVDQYNPDGSFDEHKVMLGFNDKDKAFEAYLSNYEKGWENGRRLDVTAVNLEDFEKWIQSSKRKTKPFAEYKSVKPVRYDNMGNPIDAHGNLIIENVESLNDVSDSDFVSPSRTIRLPHVPQNVSEAIGTNGRSIIIKKNIFVKNRDTHAELSPMDSRDILHRALYNPNLVGTTQPIRRPDYKVAIQTGDKNAVVVLDVYACKHNVEIVGWRKVDGKGLEKMKRQAEREGGQFLILSPGVGSAAALSALPSDVSSDGKDNAFFVDNQISEDAKRLSIDEPADKQTDEGLSSKGYTIEPKPYTNKQGKTKPFTEYKSVKPVLYDNQGNPIDHMGKLIVEDVNSIDEITDDDFVKPTRTIGLPQLPDIVSDAIGSKGKRVIIKKNIFGKNHKSHRDLTAKDSREILRTALYTPSLYGRNQKQTRPYNWILIHLADKNTCVLLEVDNSKESCEIVNWHYLGGEQLKQKERQAEREGGRILTLSEDNVVGNTSQGLSSDGKDNAFFVDNQISEDAKRLSVDEPADKQTDEGLSSKGYTIEPKPYTNKQGKTKPFAEYKSVKPKDDNSIVGRSLAEQEATDLIAQMEANAEVARELPLTPQNWANEFGTDGIIKTPIGDVKQGDNQYLKLAQQGRNGKLGMIKPTLEHPSIIIEDERPANNGNQDRSTSYVFIKTFVKKDGSRYYHFASITVSKDGKEVVISSQERSVNRISKLLQQGKVTWIDEKFSLHPTTQIEESIPLNDSNRLTSIDSQPAMLGINSSELSSFKGELMQSYSDGKDNAFFVDNQISEDTKRLSVDEPADKQTDEGLSSKGYMIEPKPYTNKQGKTLDTYLVTFERDFTKQEKSSLRTMAKDKKGWYDKETGGWMLRGREDAVAFANEVMGKDKSQLSEEAPLSIDDMQSAIKPTSEETTAEKTEISSPSEDTTSEKKAVNPSGNKLVTDEQYAELLAKMRKKMGGQLNMGMDPEVLAIGSMMAVYHIEKGARKFKVYASAMIADLGDAIRPYLKSFYNAVRDMPEAEAAGLVADMDSYDEVRSVDIANFDKPGTDAMATAAAIVKEQEVEKEKEEAEAKIKTSRKKRTAKSERKPTSDGGLFDNTIDTTPKHSGEVTLKDGSKAVIIYVTRTGNFIPGVGSTPGLIEYHGQRQDGKLVTFTDDDVLDESQSVTDFFGDSTAYKAREAQTAQLVEEIGGVIENRVAMLQLDAESVKPLTMIEVKKMASKYPALKDISDTDLQELVELAMTQLTRSEALVNIDGTAEAQRAAFDHIVNLYQIQPSLNARDSERLIKQQYSTPTPFGYVMGQFVRAGGKTVGSMLEPSAGNGALTITVHPSVIHVNDIDEARLANLRKLGYGQVTAQDALLPFAGDKVDVVMTNPPFGTVTEKVYDGVFRISSLEGQMAINALEKMKDDGRAAIVIGGNTSYRTNGSMNPKDAAFFGYLYSHYNVADVINISGKALYSRNGTGYDVRMILIDGRKTGEFQRVFPPVKAKARAEQVTRFEDLYKRVQDDIHQIQQMGHQSADVQRDLGTTTDGTTSASVRNGNNQSDTRTGLRPGTASDAVRSTPRTDSKQLTPGNDGSRPVGVDNANRRNAGSSDDVPQPNPQRTRSVGSGSIQDGRGSSGSDGRGAVASQSDRRAERLDVKPDLTTEKVPYPNQSENGFTLLSVVPAAQAQVLQKSLGEIGDVDQYLVDELGYSSKEELYSYLAAEQIDSVALAIHQMNKGNAFIIGDMTGVGKGRQGAALIRYAVKHGKVPIYFTQKPTLFTDNYRDLSDIGSSDLRPFIIASDPKDANIVDAEGKVVHKLPSKKVQKQVFNYIMEHNTLPDEYDYVLTTYDQIKNGTADYKQNEDGTWNTEVRKTSKKSNGYTTTDYNGQTRRNALARLAKGNIAILDESHTVGGDSGCGRYMQMLTSSAEGVTFLSATFAKRADNMPIYAQRTAIAEAGVKASELIEAISKGGVTLQEIMSKQLVESGQMIRRERNFEGVTIDWLSVEEETDRRQRQQFNEVADIFNAIRNFQDDYITPLINAKNESAAEFGATVGHTKGTKDLGVKNVPFASKMYNLVNQLLFALKVDAVADRVIENLRNGYKPVIRHWK